MLFSGYIYFPLEHFLPFVFSFYFPIHPTKIPNIWTFLYKKIGSLSFHAMRTYAACRFFLSGSTLTSQNHQRFHLFILIQLSAACPHFRKILWILLLIEECKNLFCHCLIIWIKLNIVCIFLKTSLNIIHSGKFIF